ncbi:MAG: hypothetical protein ACREQM_09330 [Candidatus Dormibacteraceae bacterium]
MKRPLLVGALATALVAVSWGGWSLFETGSTREFHTRVLVVFLVVGAALVGAMMAVRESSLENVSPKLQVACVAVMLAGVALFTGWRDRTWADAGDLLMLGIILGVCWRVEVAAFRLARQPVRKRIRRIRGPHLRVVS